MFARLEKEKIVRQLYDPIQKINCQCDMSSWLKEKYGGSGASGSRGRAGAKA